MATILTGMNKIQLNNLQIMSDVLSFVCLLFSLLLLFCHV